MNLPQYEVTPDGRLYKLTFISEGKNSTVEKTVLYEEINEGVSNLAFGNRDTTTGHINDRAVTSNDDTGKILATVISTVYTFINKNPDAHIFATGSTHTRNRLYRRGITKYLSEALETFTIYEILPNEKFEVFNPNTDHVGYLVHLKNKRL